MTGLDTLFYDKLTIMARVKSAATVAELDALLVLMGAAAAERIVRENGLAAGGELVESLLGKLDYENKL